MEDFPRPDALTVVAICSDLAERALVHDVVRLVQDVRRQEGLHVSDRIHLRLDCRDHREIHEAVVAGVLTALMAVAAVAGSMPLLLKYENMNTMETLGASRMRAIPAATIQKAGL